MIRIIDSKKDFGTMNTSTVSEHNLTSDDIEILKQIHPEIKNFTDETLSKEDKKLIFEGHRKKLGERYNFDWHKMYMADQENRDGSFFKINADYVRENPNGWTHIPEDILMITEDVPEVVIGHPVADCPVIIMENEQSGTTVLAHCSADLIDLHMPQMMVEAIRKETGCRAEKITAYISACAGPNWTYDKMPVWARDYSIWKQAIKEENGIFKIDIRKAINIQLDREKIERRCYNNSDTITDNRYFSNSRGKTDKEKYGRHFVGMTYTKHR